MSGPDVELCRFCRCAPNGSAPYNCTDARQAMACSWMDERQRAKLKAAFNTANIDPCAKIERLQATLRMVASGLRSEFVTREELAQLIERGANG